MGHVLTDLCAIPACVSLIGTGGCTTSQALSQRIRRNTKISPLSPDNEARAPLWRHSCESRIEVGRMWNLFNCYLSGRHEFGVSCEPGAIFLRCTHCGRRSPGWTVDTKTRKPSRDTPNPFSPRHRDRESDRISQEARPAPQ